MSADTSGAPETGGFATLSSTLLARKGHARPAMRPQGFHVSSFQSPAALDDLGWNDMGTDAPAPAKLRLADELTPLEAPPPVPVQQQADIAREFAPPAPVDPVVESEPDRSSPVVTRAAPGSKPKAAFTLRLDGDRHLRLRLVCAVTHRSAQQMVTQALDEFLARQPGNAELALAASSLNKS